MLTIALLFLAALISALALSPVAIRIGLRFGAVDHPGGRRIHAKACPRTGGIALFAAFALLLGLAVAAPPFKPWFEINQGFFLVLTGLVLAFATGLADDFRQMHCLLKLGLQIGSATLAFAAGLQIDHFTLPFVHLEFSPWLSFILTQAWFLLFINAVNLTDGLDGLASGIVFFASSVMAVLLAWRGDLQSAAWFAIISGSCLGFLRYNFHPARVFLGDGGSYFLGFCMAAFSITANFKSQLGAAFFIPLLALGIPVFDTLLAPIRRFFSGKGIFRPDEDHIHHRLLKKGLSTKKAVLTLYGLTGMLCCLSLFVAQVRDPRAGLLLIVPGIAGVVLMKRLGYFDYLSSESFVTWISDMSYAAGFHQDRRSFVDIQGKIAGAQSPNEMWGHVTQALRLFEFDLGRMELTNGHGSRDPENTSFTWSRQDQDFEAMLRQDHLLKLELPFVQARKTHLGTLWLFKDITQDGMSHYTLRRVEHLRRSISKALERMGGDKL